MGVLDSFIKPFVTIMKQPVESFIRLETAEDETTLVAEDGSLITYLKVDGSRQIIGQKEYEHILEAATVKIGARFEKQGHAVQVFFSRNPDRIEDELRALLRPNQQAAHGIGLEIDDIFEERARHLSHYISWEEIYFVLWTRSSALSKSDFAREAERARGRKWVRATDSQYPYAAMEALKTKHRSYTNAIGTALKEIGIQAEEMEVHDALRACRANLFQIGIDSDWKPCLPGDKIPARAPQSKGDYSDLLWPSLKQQITSSSARVINDKIVEMGRYVWSACDMTLGPMEATPFPQLLNRLTESKMPFRISFLIEGGGVQGMAAQAFLASIFTVTNPENRQVKDSMSALSDLALSEPVVKMRVSFATWAPKDNIPLLEDRMSALMQAIESWGFCQVSQIAGDPLDAVMSSALGIACASTAPPAILPLYEMLKLLPWQRASSPFGHGSILFRTPDGRVWPYQTGTNVTTTWFDLVFAQPGGGKSVLMNTLNLGTILTAGVSNLPYVAVIDIGPSSAGLVSLIKDALPPHRKHEAVSFRLQMNQDYAINPFDTKLGMRYPQVEERSFLVQLMTLLCTPPGQAEPYDGISQLCGMVVDEMYRWRDDRAANAEPRPYLPRIDQRIDEAMQQHDIKLPANPYWWDVMDALYDKGATYEANLAQRYAMPTLGDAIAAARRPQIRNLLEETQVGASSEGVIHAFERMITSSVREFPILSSVTRFALAENRVCALDLADVCPQGDDTANRQTAIMYMLARQALVMPWWINEETLTLMDPKYRPYHEAHLRDVAETPKRLCFDEFHRTSASKAVRSQVVRDVREGRKRGIQIVLASQMLHDFDDDMVDLATGVWVLGAAISDGAVDETQRRFGLTDTARWVMRHQLTGPRAGGGPCLLVLGTTEGRYEQHLINTLGPIELWAFSTSAEDVAIRNRLYARLGAGAARRLLAANFPGGSARSEIRRRVSMLADKGDTDKAGVGKVIDSIVEEMVDSTKVKLDAPAAPAAAPKPITFKGEEETATDEENEDGEEGEGKEIPEMPGGMPPAEPSSSSQVETPAAQPDKPTDNPADNPGAQPSSNPEEPSQQNPDQQSGQQTGQPQQPAGQPQQPQQPAQQPERRDEGGNNPPPPPPPSGEPPKE